MKDINSNHRVSSGRGWGGGGEDGHKVFLEKSKRGL